MRKGERWRTDKKKKVKETAREDGLKNIKLKVVKRLVEKLCSRLSQLLVRNAQSSWARAAIAMETTEREGCWPWKKRKKRLTMKWRKCRRPDYDGDAKKDIMMDISVDISVKLHCLVITAGVRETDPGAGWRNQVSRQDRSMAWWFVHLATGCHLTKRQS